jgi:hypothetical protein
LINNKTKQYVNDADVTMTLKTIDDIDVEDADDIILEYDEGGLGCYKGIIHSSIELIFGGFYYLYITAIKMDAILISRIKFQAVYHSGILDLEI